MITIPEIVPITDLRQDAAAVLKKLKDTRKDVVITQRGRATAVLMNIEDYERLRREREILAALVKGEEEIKAGRSFSLDEVLAEADEVLKGRE